MKKKKINEIDKYLFDLNGYIVIKKALKKSEVNECNKIIDKLTNLKHNEWSGYVHGHNYENKEGIIFQQKKLNTLRSKLKKEIEKYLGNI